MSAWVIFFTAMTQVKTTSDEDVVLYLTHLVHILFCIQHSTMHFVIKIRSKQSSAAMAEELLLSLSRQNQSSKSRGTNHNNLQGAGLIVGNKSHSDESGYK